MKNGEQKVFHRQNINDVWGETSCDQTFFAGHYFKKKNARKNNDEHIMHKMEGLCVTCSARCQNFCG